MKSMKTSVEIDIKKLELAKRLSRAKTTRDVVDQALDALIARSRRHSMLDILGTGFFVGDLDKMRDRRGDSDR
jgi:hypothetical protein